VSVSHERQRRRAYQPLATGVGQRRLHSAEEPAHVSRPGRELVARSAEYEREASVIAGQLAAVEQQRDFATRQLAEQRQARRQWEAAVYSLEAEASALDAAFSRLAASEECGRLAAVARAEESARSRHATTASAAADAAGTAAAALAEACAAAARDARVRADVEVTAREATAREEAMRMEMELELARRTTELTSDERDKWHAEAHAAAAELAALRRRVRVLEQPPPQQPPPPRLSPRQSTPPPPPPPVKSRFTQCTDRAPSPGAANSVSNHAACCRCAARVTMCRVRRRRKPRRAHGQATPRLRVRAVCARAERRGRNLRLQPRWWPGRAAVRTRAGRDTRRMMRNERAPPREETRERERESRITHESPTCAAVRGV
jgi:hypothetical protein